MRWMLHTIFIVCKIYLINFFCLAELVITPPPPLNVYTLVTCLPILPVISLVLDCILIEDN